MRSMTGFGRVTATADGREAVLEIKSVNHRFLDLSFRVPRALNFLEEPLRKAMQARLSRGHVDLYLGYRNERVDAREVALNEALVDAYQKAFHHMREMTGLKDDMTLSTLAAMPDVLTAKEREEDREAVTLLALEALGGALSELIASRETEGERLAGDIEARLAAIEEHLIIVESRMDAAVREAQERLMARIQEWIGALVDPARIAQEAAILADKSAIDEETVRLRSHIAAARDAMAQSEPAGRKMDFIVQEMHREVNTMGSKSSDLTITNAVLSMKGEVEKIREQVQNIE